jgi:4-hydroxy-tetrahydrodipicolinate synthase
MSRVPELTRGHALRGVYPVFNTVFDDDENVDDEGLRRELHWIADQGVDGVVLGIVSEVLRLSPAERTSVARTACEVAEERGIHCIISVGAESTHLAVSLAQEAEAVGATALMAIPPVTVGLPEPAIKAYFAAILDATRVPLVVQDASGYVGRPLSLDVQTELLDTYGDRVFFKPEATPIGPRLSALRDATQARAPVFEGTGGIALIDSYRRGIVGTMPGADLCWALVRMWRLLGAGGFEAAYDIAGPLASLISMQSSLDSFVAFEKYLLKAQGVLKNTGCRRPVSVELDPETQAEIDRLFDLLQRKCAAAAPA